MLLIEIFLSFKTHMAENIKKNNNLEFSTCDVQYIKHRKLHSTSQGRIIQHTITLLTYPDI